MGTKFTKELVDGTLVCDPRGGWCAKMGLQDAAETQDWTELIIAAFVSLTGIADNNSAWTTVETFNPCGAFDRFLFGLKDDDDAKMIGVADTYFMGMASKLGEKTGLIYYAGGSEMDLTNGGGSGYTAFATSNGVTVNETASASLANSFYFGFTGDTVAATNYARFIGIKFVRTNVGTATESVQMYSGRGNVPTGGATKFTDVSISSLRTIVNNFPSANGANSGVMTFNTGAAPYPTPDTWYIRWPFLGSRLRIHAAMYQVNAL